LGVLRPHSEQSKRGALHEYTQAFSGYLARESVKRVGAPSATPPVFLHSSGARVTAADLDAIRAACPYENRRVGSVPEMAAASRAVAATYACVAARGYLLHPDVYEEIKRRGLFGERQ
jgi:hypothetical protein